jgi:FimV-like protein
MQSFPDLQTMDEAQLNLDLAEQYIELGAYESARVILQTNQSLFNQDQQQYVEKLLNKIAS